MNMLARNYLLDACGKDSQRNSISFNQHLIKKLYMCKDGQKQQGINLH